MPGRMTSQQATMSNDRIPSEEECYRLMARYSMLPNIAEHSRQVMRVSVAIADNLKKGVPINREMVVAASLLHDITKTRSLQTRERHDASGGELLRELGFAGVADIVEQHVFFKDPTPRESLEEREIVYYADKRVMHSKIVTVDERLQDLALRYGVTEAIRCSILQNKSVVLAVEGKIAGFMKTDLHQAIQEIAAGLGEAPAIAAYQVCG